MTVVIISSESFIYQPNYDKNLSSRNPSGSRVIIIFINGWLPIKMNEIYPQEVIKEYLQYNSLTTTLECFVAEVKSKSLAPSKLKKKQKKEAALQLPRLYTFCMGEEARSANSQGVEKRLAQSTKSNEMMLKSAQRIFEIAVDAVGLLEEGKLAEETVAGYKLQLSKLQHDIGVKSIKSKESAILNPAYVQSQRNQIIHFLESKEYPQLTQVLMKIRLECLNVKQKSRLQLIDALQENDILGGSINLLLTCKNYSVVSASTALVSILCSADSGKKYVLGSNAEYICTLVTNILKREEGHSVCSRFAVALLEKLSLNDLAANCMIESSLIQHLTEKTISLNAHPFILTFSTALLFNLLSVQSGRSYISSNHDEVNKVLHKLVTLSKDTKATLDVVLHCLLCINRILKVYPNLLPGKDIGKIVELVRESEEKDDEYKAKIFEVSGKLLNRQGRKEEKLKGKKEKVQKGEEVIYFECFTDEAPLLSG